ncbi:FtsK/SpoIIIE domain-containing protein [Mangrovibacillus cuniculi]|uniref:Cell division protein FtsK n=1 Tax=Mangrovibacillus cuniculi TaxID=2593652 RepID=A0A7S8HG05_9BACI|nr:FtsK/SpoIIIE domain-containing protein [Mangrovibacillus cuniculi]QPC47091.1 cell division protein FtsK [Mangrovibacillus cuniculi]QPC48502.1 cell division protein FtsK [Mangrovibacillus cuniculi]
MSVLQKIVIKSKLRYAFKKASIFTSYKKGTETYLRRPKIHHVDVKEKYVEIVFTLPNGFNPEEMLSKRYVLQQVFGRNLTLEGDLKKFVLKLYFKGLPKEVTYRREELEELCQGIPLPIVCGKDLNGEHVVYDANLSPHLLVSGETGSGKSSLLRVILTTLILSKPVEEVQFILGDLKRSEFGLFRNQSHVRGVYVSPKELLAALKKVNAEILKRGDLLDEHEVTHVEDLPMKVPYIIVAIDEVALLKGESAIMNIIDNIGAVGRSLGVQLILSMQRPDHKLLEGKLKNNLTVRISGRQSNKTNANIAGAEDAHMIKISEKGRMILNLEKLIELQSPWLSYQKAKKLLVPFKTIPTEKGAEVKEKKLLETLPENLLNEEDIIL